MKKRPILREISGTEAVREAEMEFFLPILRRALLAALREAGFLTERQMASILGETEWMR